MYPAGTPLPNKPSVPAAPGCRGDMATMVGITLFSESSCSAGTEMAVWRGQGYSRDRGTADPGMALQDAPGWQEERAERACGIASPVAHLESAVSLFASR